jgi:hypothetical protein
MGNLLDNYQLPKGNSISKTKHELPIDAVDQLADELVREYGNPLYRKWYCGVIYEYGFSQVNEWRKRASEGDEPGKLFSKYVKDTQTYKSNRGVP